MAAAEAKLRVVASRSHGKETTTARDGDRSAPEQRALPFDEPSPSVTARRVIPLVHPSRGTPEPAPARRDNPPHDTDAPASGAPHDPFPGRFTKVPLAIANHYGRELGTTKTRILEVMHHLIYGYGANPVGRRQGQISYKEIADAAGISVRTVERQLPKLIEDRFVKRLSLGQPNKSASVYELTFKALTPQHVGPSGGQMATFPRRGDYRQNVGSKDSDDRQPTTDKLSVVTAVETPGTTDKMSGNYKREETNQRESSRSRAAPAASAASPASEITDTNPLAAIIRKHWPTIKRRPVDRCLAEFDQVSASSSEITQACARHGPRLAIETVNPVLWAQKLCDGILRDRRRQPDPQTETSIASEPPPPPPPPRGHPVLSRIKEAVRGATTPATFENWIKPLGFAGLHGRRLRLYAPTSSCKEWVEAELWEVLTQATGREGLELAPIELPAIEKSSLKPGGNIGR